MEGAATEKALHVTEPTQRTFVRVEVDSEGGEPFRYPGPKPFRACKGQKQHFE